jgi:hypothetical protein
MANDPNAMMNAMIAEGATRGERLTTGALARLFGEPPVSESSRERLDMLEAERREAMRIGDDAALGLIEHNLDRLFEEARAARTEQPRDAQGRFVGADQHADHSDGPIDFDGGVRGRQPRPSPGIGVESSNDLMQRALSASRVERREREADQTVILRNT